MATKEQIATVAKHYLIACIFTDAPEGTHPRATIAAVKKAYEDCSAFIEACGPLFDMAMAQFSEGYGAHPDAGSAEAAFGHDFWLTRQGHGTGFWDRKELGDKLGKLLTKLCGFRTDFCEVYPEFYRGWLYFN